MLAGPPRRIQRERAGPPRLVAAVRFDPSATGHVGDLSPPLMPPNRSIRSWMSATRQAVIRGPSLTGRGKRPDLTPSHQVDLLTGITAGIGGCARAFPMI